MTINPSLSFDAAQPALLALIKENIAAQQGWLSFAAFMQLALYAPALGYYTAGTQKFGKGGDFVTAPEISALFGQTLAQQIKQVLTNTHGSILELGAGTGKLAVDVLLTLQETQALPVQYYILEVSNHLRQVQCETLQKYLPDYLFQRVVWLDALPIHFDGIIIGNEVLDAIPVHLLHQQATGLYERGLGFVEDKLVWQDRLLMDNRQNSEHILTENAAHKDAIASQLIAMANAQNLPDDYLTEFCPAAAGLMTSLAQALNKGAIVMIDYGFSAREYYHPQRHQGTLMCHYQQTAHADPLINIGLQDITAHVDFTSIAQAGVDGGLALSGYCSQAQFLMNCGILGILQQTSPNDMARYAPLAAAAQKLLSPAEMGDLFKVMAFTKNLDKALNWPLLGFTSGDKSHTL